MAAVSPNDTEHAGWSAPDTVEKPLPEGCSLQDPKLRRRLCIQVYKNLLVLSVALMVVFTGHFPITTIQSSLHPEKGLGTASLSVHTAAAMIQSLFFNTLAIRRLGLKACMLIGIGFLGVYIACNAYPRWYTLIPSALISGIGYALLRTAESSYVARLAATYATHMGLSPDSTKSRFFAVYYVFYCSARVSGNVASSLILGGGFGGFDLSSTDVTHATAAANASYCGADHCDLHDLGNTSRLVETAQPSPDVYLVYFLCVFCIGCLAIAVLLLVVLLDTLEKLAAQCEVHIALPAGGKSSPHGWRDLLATLRTWRNPQQLLLLPLCMYNGVDNVFWQADFTKSFVTCAYGIKWVGFAVAWYGLTAPLIVLVLALTSKVVCRPIPFLVALVAHLGTAIALLYSPLTSLPHLFILSGVWGIGSGLWPVCLIAYHGILFESNLEGAFSTYWLCDALGATLFYAVSYWLCMSSKIDIVIGLVSIGFLGYLLTEMTAFVQKVRDSNRVQSTLPVTS